jgi:hypothetical protein
VRMKLAKLAAAFILFGAAGAPRASAQNPDTLLPEQSVAKARQVLQQLIDALGGPRYLSVRESECAGRRALFGHNGELAGYIDFTDARRYPDKNRIEYIAKGHTGIFNYLIGVDGLDIRRGGVTSVLYNGDQGWTLDRGGVSELPATALAEFQEQVKQNINNLLRLRLKEDGMVFRYAGSDVVDLKQVDWVELVDRDTRTFRLAVDRTSHLLVRSMVITSGDTTGDDIPRERTEENTIYSNYQLRDGVQTPLQISREHNGRRVYQAFYETCKYNPGFPDDLFTKASLEKRYADSGGKKDKKKNAQD